MHALVLALSGLVAAIALGAFVPWCSRLMAIYWAHFIRDRIYAVGDAHPAFRETLIYQDAERMACLVIHALRKRDGKFLSEMALVITTERTRRPANRDQWRRRRYSLEISQTYTGPAGVEAYCQLVDAFLELDGPVLVASCGQHPARALLFLIYVPLRLLNAVLDRITRITRSTAKSDRVIARANSAYSI